MESSLDSRLGNQKLELLQSFHRLARGKCSSEPWKVTPKVSCFYQMPKKYQEVVDQKYQALDERLKKFVCQMFTTLSKDQEKELLTAFCNFSSEDLSSMLENKRSQWQWMFEDPDPWRQLNEDQRLHVQNKFSEIRTNILEFLSNFAALCEKEKEELFNLMKKKEELLECPVCTDLPSGEIFSCSNQHVICSGCLPQLVGNTCPTCREDLGVRPRHHIFAEAGVRELRLLREVTGSPTEQRKPRTM